tara:strand:+ start:2602 stop:5385 length:2784 start_codon:yes stop_codon:yes gene_type:complete
MARRFPSQYIGKPVSDIPPDVYEQVVAQSGTYFEDENGLLQSHNRTPRQKLGITNNPTPADPDIFTSPATPAAGVTNTSLTATERRRIDQQAGPNSVNSGVLNYQATSGVFYAGMDGPEPPRSDTGGVFSAGMDGPEPEDFRAPVTDGQVAAPTNSENIMSAGGSAMAANARNNSAADGLSPNFDSISIDPLPNQLSDYASHTYNIALYMLQPAEYVKLMKAPKSVAQIPKRLIMRSGGVSSDGGENFDIDFFIDNLQMTNLGISPNTRTTNTNAVSISFDITEPMGITLIERLKTEAKNSLQEEENYIRTPYLLEITFKGYDDTGEEVVGAIKPKYIPIRITDLKFKLESSGTIYKINAIPFHQDVFSSMTSTIPINIQVSAGTVNDIFGGTAQQVNYETETIYDEELAEDEGTTIKKTTLGESAATLTDAVNRFFVNQTKPTTDKDGKTQQPSAEIAEKWSFEIAPEINNAKLVGAKFDALNTPQKTNKVYKQAAAGIKGQVNLDSTTNLFKINAGTNVVSLINYIVVASEYIDSNIDAANGIDNDFQQPTGRQTSENKTIKWFKVVPQIVDYIGWDKKQGRYKFHVKWTLMVHGMYYSDFPWAPKTKPKGIGVHKMYDYIFSGLNTEITDLILQFDAAYYQAHTIGTGIPEGDKDKSNLAPMSKSVPQSKQGQGIINDTTVTKKRSKDLMSNLMYDGADMIQINLAILGDPSFLPVGDAFHQPQGNRNKAHNKPFLDDGTINYDLTPPYIQLNLKTPSDYDELTGLVDPYSKGTYTTSEFSGVYRVISTESSFSGGMFTQRVDAIREKMQPINGKIGRSVESIKITEDNTRRSFIENLSESLFLSVVSGKNPFEALISQGSSLLSSVGESLVTGMQAGRIQRLADEIDQGRFEEGIGEEIDSFRQIQDDGRIINNNDTADIFEE